MATRSERGRARRLANRFLTLQRFEFESSSSARVYETVVQLDGKLMCNCRGWIIKKKGKPRTCGHVQRVVAQRPTRSDGEYLYLVTPERT